MPLSFNSLSHGNIAFGFFNIESDMLLLDKYFFFATEFCEMVKRLSESEDGTAVDLPWTVNMIDSPEKIGDLMGAIHGVRFSGFIGDVYQLYPFPERQEEFKQKPSGSATQTEIAKLIKPYAIDTAVDVIAKGNGSEISIGCYRFERPEFQRLLDYVWLGGYPRWKDDIRPWYVADMRERVLSSANFLFKDIKFSF